MILAFSANDHLPDLPKFLRNGLLGLGTRYGNERRIILKLKTCTFPWHTSGTTISIFIFFGELPFTLFPKSFRNGYLGIRKRYAVALSVALPIWTCTFTWTSLGTSIKDFRFFGGRPFTWSPKVSQKWITRSKNTLRRWEEDHIEAKNMYFHLTYLANLY